MARGSECKPQASCKPRPRRTGAAGPACWRGASVRCEGARHALKRSRAGRRRLASGRSVAASHRLSRFAAMPGLGPARARRAGSPYRRRSAVILFRRADDRLSPWASDGLSKPGRGRRAAEIGGDSGFSAAAARRIATSIRLIRRFGNWGPPGAVDPNSDAEIYWTVLSESACSTQSGLGAAKWLRSAKGDESSVEGHAWPSSTASIVLTFHSTGENSP